MLPQCLHFLATARIDSPHKGHGFSACGRDVAFAKPPFGIVSLGFCGGVYVLCALGWGWG